MPIVLIGFMGAGKSSVARLIAPGDFVDSDTLIAEWVGCSISDYVSRFGVSEFRQREEEILAKLLVPGSEVARHVEVIATGGGIVESEKNRALLRVQEHVAYLQADFQTLLDRIKNDQANQRFIFENSDLADFEKVYSRRLPLYQGLAKLKIDTGASEPKEIARLILEKFPI